MNNFNNRKNTLDAWQMRPAGFASGYLTDDYYPLPMSMRSATINMNLINFFNFQDASLQVFNRTPGEGRPLPKYLTG